MKILFLNVPMQGHINPTLPVVKELVKGGHVVDYYCSAASRKKVESTGANFKDYDIEFEAIDPRKKFQMINGAVKFIIFAKLSINKYFEIWRKENYDLVIHDSCAYAGIILERTLDVKAINSTTTMFHTMDTIKKSESGVAAVDFFNSILTQPAQWFRFTFHSLCMLKKYRFRPTTLDVLTSVCDLNVTYTARELQPYQEVLNPKEFRFIGSVIEDRPKDPDFPYEFMESSRIVYVSLGTVYTTNETFILNCVKALRNIENLRVIISLGSNISIDKLGDIPANFVVRKFIPQLDVLKKADVFISHAGNNSLNESLSFAVPMVLCPQQSEQKGAAFEFEKMGVAINTKSSCPDAKVIENSVLKILADDSFRKKALKASKDLENARQGESFLEIVNNYV